MDTATSDPGRTCGRIACLKGYFRDNVLSTKGQFVCLCAAGCQESHQRKTPGGVFYEGQLHHIGKHYDLSIGGKDLRVVVLAQEYGHNPSHCDMAARHLMIWQESGLNRRFHAEPGHKARNPHMRGTTSVLRLAFGGEPGADHPGEFLELGGERVHIFDAFALVNFLLCSAVGPDRPSPTTEHAPEAIVGGARGRSTPDMRRNCASHLRRSLEILQPNLIVTQGRGVWEWLGQEQKQIVDTRRPALPANEAHNYGDLEWVTVGETRALLAGFSHPSARGRLGWGSNDNQGYLLNTVRPTMIKARRLLGL